MCVSEIMDNRISLKFPALSENERLARTIAAAFVIDLDPTIEEMGEIKTAISEAVTNAIIHAYKNNEGEISMEAFIDGEEVCYIIEDFGCGIEDIEKAREPLYTGRPQDERSGMGFSIMESFMDKLQVESTVGKGTKIAMWKRIVADGE